MEKRKIKEAVAWLENLLNNFREAKEKGKGTNSNTERAESIAEIKNITERLESYIRNNEELLEQITGTQIEVARDIDWNDVVRPSHFEEDLQGEINKLKDKAA